MSPARPHDCAPIRVLLADDHPAVRAGVRHELQAAGDLVVVAEAGTVAEAVRLAGALQPAVAVLDVQLAGGSGTEAGRQIAAGCPQVAVLLFTAFDWDVYLAQAWAAGAAGVVIKQVELAALAAAIRRVAAGQQLWTPAQRQRVSAWQREVAARLARLTPRERAVLRLVAAGRRNREIAASLCLAEKSVENYVGRILTKLEFQSRTQLALWATQERVLLAWHDLTAGE